VFVAEDLAVRQWGGRPTHHLWLYCQTRNTTSCRGRLQLLPGFQFGNCLHMLELGLERLSQLF
jgi:hypothetical protein